MSRTGVVVLVSLPIPVGACDSGGSDSGVPDGGGCSSPDGSVPLPDGCDLEGLTYAGFAEALFEARCLPCHSSALEGAARLAAPVGVDFDTEADIAFHQARIAVRAVEQRDMPPGAPLDECEAAQLASYLQSLGGVGACEPSCDGAQCGDDDCGGSWRGCGATCGAGSCVLPDVSFEDVCSGLSAGEIDTVRAWISGL